MTKLVKAIHQIHVTLPGGEGEFRETPEGKTVIAKKAVPTVVVPGQLFVPMTDETLDELVRLGAVTDPSEAELALYEQTEGRKAAAVAAAAPVPAPAGGKGGKSASSDDVIG